MVGTSENQANLFARETVVKTVLYQNPEVKTAKMSRPSEQKR